MCSLSRNPKSSRSFSCLHTPQIFLPMPDSNPACRFGATAVDVCGVVRGSRTPTSRRTPAPQAGGSAGFPHNGEDGALGGRRTPTPSRASASETEMYASSITSAEVAERARLELAGPGGPIRFPIGGRHPAGGLSSKWCDVEDLHPPSPLAPGLQPGPLLPTVYRRVVREAGVEPALPLSEQPDFEPGGSACSPIRA